MVAIKGVTDNPQWGQKRLPDESLWQYIMRQWGNSNAVMPSVGTMVPRSGDARIIGEVAKATTRAGARAAYKKATSQKEWAEAVDDTINASGPWGTISGDPLKNNVQAAIMNAPAYLISKARDAADKVSKPISDRLDRYLQSGVDDVIKKANAEYDASKQATALETGGSNQTVTGSDWKSKTTDVSKMTPEELAAYVASLGGK